MSQDQRFKVVPSANTVVSPRSSPLGTFLLRNALSLAAMNEERRLYSQARVACYRLSNSKHDLYVKGTRKYERVISCFLNSAGATISDKARGNDVFYFLQS